MGKKTAFHVKVKSIPPPGFKHRFYEGVIIASNEKEAGESACEYLKNVVAASAPDGTPVELQFEVFRVKRLRTDFIRDASKPVPL